MKVRAVDANGDWLYGKGQNDYAQNNAAVAQIIAMRLKSFLGDCFFDSGAGLDWLNLLGAKKSTALNLAIASVILNTDNVTRLDQLTAVVSPTTRAVTITYAVTTTFSRVSATLTLNPNAV